MHLPTYARGKQSIYRAAFTYEFVPALSMMFSIPLRLFLSNASPPPPGLISASAFAVVPMWGAHLDCRVRERTNIIIY